MSPALCRAGRRGWRSRGQQRRRSSAVPPCGGGRCQGVGGASPCVWSARGASGAGGARDEAEDRARHRVARALSHRDLRGARLQGRGEGRGRARSDEIAPDRTRSGEIVGALAWKAIAKAPAQLARTPAAYVALVTVSSLASARAAHLARSGEIRSDPSEVRGGAGAGQRHSGRQAAGERTCRCRWRARGRRRARRRGRRRRAGRAQPPVSRERGTPGLWGRLKRGAGAHGKPTSYTEGALRVVWGRPEPSGGPGRRMDRWRRAGWRALCTSGATSSSPTAQRTFCPEQHTSREPEKETSSGRAARGAASYRATPCGLAP